MKKLFLLIGAFGLLSMTSKGIDLNETKEKMVVSISSIGIPIVSGGHVNIPVKIRFDNNGASQLKLDSIFATIHSIDSTGAKVKIASTAPQPELQILAPNQTSYKELIFSFPVLSNISNLSQLLKTKQLLITAVPKINGFDTPPIEEIHPVNLGNILNLVGLVNAGQG
ncbi:hypothetical protein [Aureibacter tunicatorum]|uniref:Kynurenine formamidase n=1 Tax=Aureibacter tunicatorum TaxID=866807 RepID=A0AAE3XNY7_9BACT|nr:hypothetical protein [Aureibacter tunicatorum]MDR6239947.1 kynurenine formamidase [Aureibacter tunicatorum]